MRLRSLTGDSFAVLASGPVIVLQRTADTLHSLRLIFLLEMVMRKLAMLAAAGCVCLLAGAGALDGGQPLTLQITPAMAPAPAFLSVRAVIEANDENRSLEIAADSPEFFRSSRVDLDGRNAPRLAVVEFRSLPAGLYDVSGVLVGTGGKRARVSRSIRVVGMTGPGQ
jgi:hypothetical protein